MSTLVRGERLGLSRWEQALRIASAALGVISLGFAVSYLVRGVSGDAEYPYVVNSIAKDALLAGVCLLVFWDVRRWAAVAVPLIVAAHVLMPALLLQTALTGGDGVSHTIGGNGALVRWVWLGVDILVVGLFVVLHHQAIRSRYDLRYLPPSAFRALMALAEVLVVKQDPEIAPAEVAVRADHYLASFRARQKWKIRLALLALAYWPVVTLRPPFHIMSPEVRERWVRRRFFEEVADRATPAPLRRYRQTFIRTAQQFCFMGYYGDERAARKVGYLPFSQRPEYAAAMEHVTPDRRGVTCLAADTLARDSLTADVVIVGTGAGGATLAYELAARGREVLLVERGPHVAPSAFTEDEATQLSNLYADGALMLSADFQFQVAQGMCVGGSTVVNNAVCFDLPDPVRDRWLDPAGLNAGLDPVRLAAAFAHVRDFLRINDRTPLDRLNPGAARILGGLAALPEDRLRTMRLVECNVADCLGCGFCNIGCAYGKKLSALDWTLPLAQERFPGRVRILPECQVEKVEHRGGRATGVVARRADGRRLTIDAGTVVLSAGAIASSAILLRSGLGDGRAGRGLAFNMASPVTLDFDEALHSERGLQISHYLERIAGEDDGLALETWFNPIVTQSLFMPGWFDEHWDNMRRYGNMTCLGVVIGTGSDATVKLDRLGGGATFDYTPSNDDLVRLKAGLRLAAEIGMEAGARRVLPATFRMLELRTPRDLARIDEEIGDHTDVSVNSAHPQGGNPVSADPLKGVVDPDGLRVYGTTNVHVVDASVFPSSITVNPQLTVMALAAYVADDLAGPRPAAQPASRSQVPAFGPGS